MAACGVSYLSLVLTHFSLLEEASDAFLDLSADILPKGWADKVEELATCRFCASFWLALIVTRGRPIRALQIAGMASIPTSAVLIATD